MPTFAQTVTARTFITPSFSAILIISHNQWAQASIDGYAQGFPETIFLKPTPLPSEIYPGKCAGHEWRFVKRELLF